MTAPPDLDALADLCARLRTECYCDPSRQFRCDQCSAVAALKLLAREKESNWVLADRTRIRAERAEAERDVWKDKAETRGREGCKARAERDALRECVRELVACADESDSLAAERLYGKPHTPEYKTRELDHRQRSIEAWKAARAKVKP